MWPYIMDNLLRVGTLLVCLGFAAPVPAQTYDESPVPVDSTNCRAVVGQAEIDGTMQQIVGRACLQSDGTWQIVQSPDGSVLWYPVAAYPYPDPWWWGPPIFIGAGVSFIFVDHFHHFHHFDHFHQIRVTATLHSSARAFIAARSPVVVCMISVVRGDSAACMGSAERRDSAGCIGTSRKVPGDVER